jgi:uncharacterized protein (UPF0147 family)
MTKDKITISVDATNLEVFKDMINVIKDVTNDERIPSDVREEIMDKVNLIIESRQDG